MKRTLRTLTLVALLASLAGSADAAIAPLPMGPAITQASPASGIPLLALANPGARHTWTLDSDGDRRHGLRGGRLAPVMHHHGVLFRFKAKYASQVSVVGSFNDWDPIADEMDRRRDGTWRTTIDLDDGEWPYLFVVDGQWVQDPDNPVVTLPELVDGEDLGDVSLVHVKRDEVVLPLAPGHREGDTEIFGAYDRVNQVTLSAALRYQNRVQMHPDLHAVAGYSFGRERWLYDAGFAQPFFGTEILDVGVDAYRRNATPDDFRIGSTENSLAAFFFRQDWRDYHEAEGVSAFVRTYLGPVAHLQVRWRREDHLSVSKTTNWGLFEGGTRMRSNGPVNEGQLRSVTTSWELDTRNSLHNPTRGLFAATSWEWAGGELGGDFEFQRGHVDLRKYLKLSPDHYLDVRILGGLIDEAHRDGEDGTLSGYDAIPVQERLYLGGIGTMRATQFKSLAGDRALLANVEMRVEIWDDLQIVLFGDLGDAWVEATDEFDLKADAGIGLQDADASFRINLAKKVDNRTGNDDVWMTARIQRMF